jgi:hypothetical protein
MAPNTSTTEAPVEFEKGTWQATLRESSTLLDRSAKARNRASALLWAGAQTGIESWIDDPSEDVSAEGLYATVMEALGKSRKGDASKIKTVALAVLNNGLEMGQFDNLSKAYAEASRLTKTVRVEAEEDNAAEAVIASIEAPKTASTLESAAALLLSKGVDGAVVAILDLLETEPAQRSFMRAVSTEVASRVQAKAAAEKAAKDAERAKEKEARDAEREAKQAEREAAAAERAKTKAAAAKKASTKPKTAAKKAAPAKASTTGKPAPAKAKPAPVRAKARPVAKRG